MIRLRMLLMGVTGFDRAKSNRVDSTVGDDRKSSKINTRKRRSICSSRLSLSRGRKDLVIKPTKGASAPFYIIQKFHLTHRKETQ
jgi:hypothetical protein